MKIILGLYLVLFAFQSGKAQQERQVLSDTTSILVLLDKADAMADSAPKLAMQWAQEAGSKSITANYKSGIVKSLNQQGRVHNIEGHFDSTLVKSREAILFAQQNNLQEELAIAYTQSGEAFMRLHNSDSAGNYLNKALGHAEQLKDVVLQAGIYNNIANNFLNDGLLEEALTSFIKAAYLFESMSDQSGVAKAWANIGNIQFLLKDYQKAKQYTKSSLAIAKANKNYLTIAYCHKLLARISRKENQYSNALLEYDSALQTYLPLNANRDATEATINIGNIYFDLKEFDKAIGYYKKSFTIAGLNYKPITVYSYSALSSAYREKKQHTLALAFADSVIQIARKINMYLVMDARETKSLIYTDLKDYKLALENHILFTNLKDSLSEAENRERIADIEAKYQNDLKQNEIEKLKQAQELSDLKITRQRTIMGIGVISILSILLAAGLLINRYRVLNRSKRELELERMRNNISRDLHDDIGSTLSSIKILSQVALTEQNGNTQNYLQRIGDQSTRMMEDMSDMVWSINPRNDSIDKVITRMREFATEIFEASSIEYHFSHKINDELTLDSEKRKNLFLIFKEAINNAAKYSKANLVEISLYLQDQTLILIVRDNGRGFDEQEITAGNGLRNQRERAKEFDGSFNITSQTGKGTELELRLPIA